MNNSSDMHPTGQSSPASPASPASPVLCNTPGLIPHVVLREGSTRPKPPRSRVATWAVLGAIVVAGSTLSACSRVSKQHFTVGSVQKDYRIRHPIVISEQEETMDVPVATGTSKLTKAAASSVRGFAREFSTSAGGTIRVMLPSGSSNEAAGRIVGQQIVAVLQKQGIPSRRIISAPYFAGQDGAAAPIRLSYASIQANVKGCGQWPDDLTNSIENGQYFNFGCATQNNLAEMVANPSDLLAPRGTTSIDAARRSKVLEKFREGKDTATERAESSSSITNSP